MAEMAATKPTSVVLTGVHPNAIFGEIELAGPRFKRRIRADPLGALRESLEIARASCLDFDSSWEPSVERALSGQRGVAREEWSCAIRQTREVWRSAYLLEPKGRPERWAGVLQPP
jgi:hypothetical protein